MRLGILRDGPADGASNMARDEALARRVAAGAPPAVRLYGWSPPAVSIGFHQPEECVDGAALARAGIGLVRRPTGGRAILHWHELTYCAALPLALGSPRFLYRLVHAAILRGLRLLGIDADAPEEAGAPLPRPDDPLGVSCFSALAGSEIRAGGRKLVGSAQRRFGAAVLQHGSILLGPGHRELARYIAGPGGTAAALALADGTVEAETLLGRPVTFDEAGDAVASGFEEVFAGIAAAGGVPVPGPPGASPGPAVLRSVAPAAG